MMSKELRIADCGSRIVDCGSRIVLNPEARGEHASVPNTQRFHSEHYACPLSLAGAVLSAKSAIRNPQSAIFFGLRIASS